MGEWLHYNFADGGIHTKNIVADFNWLKLIFKKQKSLSGPPLEDLEVTYALDL